MQTRYIAASLLLLAAAGAGGYYVATNRMRGRRWSFLLPVMQQRAQQHLDAATRAGLDVMFYDGWRDPVDTRANIERGTSKVKDEFASPHTWGVAYDLVFRHPVTGLPWWPPIWGKDAAGNPVFILENYKQWEAMGKIGESLGLTWGGRWFNPLTLKGFFDGPHFQLKPLSMAYLRRTYQNDYAGYLTAQGVAVA